MASHFTRRASGGVGPRRIHIAGPMAPNIPRSVTDLETKVLEVAVRTIELEDAVRDVDQPDPPACPWEFQADPHGVPQDEEARSAPRKIPKYSDMLISYSTIPGESLILDLNL